MSEIDYESIIKKNPDVLKISFSEITKALNKKNIIFNANLKWSEMGLDDLDIIEMIMEIEKDLDIVINDETVFEIFDINFYPVDFRYFIRNNKLNKILK
jgi:acyl carrier protein